MSSNHKRRTGLRRGRDENRLSTAPSASGVPAGIVAAGIFLFVGCGEVKIDYECQ
jgi:hypothetical protein